MRVTPEPRNDPVERSRLTEATKMDGSGCEGFMSCNRLKRRDRSTKSRGGDNTFRWPKESINCYRKDIFIALAISHGSNSKQSLPRTVLAPKRFRKVALHGTQS